MSKLIADIQTLSDLDLPFRTSPKFLSVKRITDFVRIICRLTGKRSIAQESYQVLVEHFNPQMKRVLDEWSKNIDH